VDSGEVGLGGDGKPPVLDLAELFDLVLSFADLPTTDVVAEAVLDALALLAVFLVAEAVLDALALLAVFLAELAVAVVLVVTGAPDLLLVFDVVVLVSFVLVSFVLIFVDLVSLVLVSFVLMFVDLVSLFLVSFVLIFVDLVSFVSLVSLVSFVSFVSLVSLFLVSEVFPSRRTARRLLLLPVDLAEALEVVLLDPALAEATLELPTDFAPACDFAFDLADDPSLPPGLPAGPLIESFCKH